MVAKDAMPTGFLNNSENTCIWIAPWFAVYLLFDADYSQARALSLDACQINIGGAEGDQGAGVVYESGSGRVCGFD